MATKKKGKKAAKPLVVPDAKAAKDNMKRLGMMSNLGARIASKKKQIEKQERIRDEAKGTLEAEKESLSEMNAELADFQEELDDLACGKFIEKLIPEASIPAEKEKTSEKTTTERDARYYAATLKDLGVPKAISDKLELDGIKCGKDIQNWFSERPQPRKIQGVGEESVEKVKDAVAKWFSDNPEDVKSDAAA